MERRVDDSFVFLPFLIEWIDDIITNQEFGLENKQIFFFLIVNL